MEFLLIGENTTLPNFKDKLRWNSMYYRLAGGL
jgi:L-arabinose isomerase